MSYEDGWAAINLDMPKRVPRTEYSAEFHWDLLKAVTGIDVGVESRHDVKIRAADGFIRAWNYDFWWSTPVSRGEFGQLRTSMGHAEYQAGGIDRDDNIHCPFNDPEEVLEFDPMATFGRRQHAELVQWLEQLYLGECRSRPTCVTMTGTYVTCISAMIDLFGWDMLLLAAGLDPKRFGDLANRYAAWFQQYFDAIADTDIPLVLVHDDMVWSSGAFLHPDWYRQYVFPNIKKYVAPLIDSNKKVLFASDGDYTEFIDDIIQIGVCGLVMEPFTDMRYIAEKYGKTHCFIGNADTRLLLGGSRRQIRAEVERCMAIGKNCPGYILAVGNHIPPNTPVENALYYNEVYEELSKR